MSRASGQGVQDELKGIQDEMDVWVPVLTSRTSSSPLSGGKEGSLSEAFPRSFEEKLLRDDCPFGLCFLTNCLSTSTDFCASWLPRTKLGSPQARLEE